MSKNGIRGYITLAVILIVFSVIAFALPFSKTATFWLAFLFGVIAIAYQIYVFKISFSGDGDVKSKFYGFPIAKVGVIYLGAQMVLSLIEIIASGLIPVWVALILNILPIAYGVIGCVAADAMREEIVRQDVQLKKDVSNMRTLQSLSVSLVGLCSDGELKKVLQNVADEFKYSDPVTSEETAPLEQELQQQMKKIQSAVVEGDLESANVLCSKVLAGLAERNRVCLLNKKS